MTRLRYSARLAFKRMPFGGALTVDGFIIGEGVLETAGAAFTVGEAVTADGRAAGHYAGYAVWHGAPSPLAEDGDTASLFYTGDPATLAGGALDEPGPVIAAPLPAHTGTAARQTDARKEISMNLAEALKQMPVLAVLRGMSPDEAVPVGEALLDARILVMEVPLNSPDPYRSIAIQAERFGDRAIVGAGTVLKPEEVARVADAGGRIVVSPNLNEEVVRATKRCGLISVPGVFTPSEAFRALDAGADALKLFPGDGLSPKVVKAMRAVLPKGTLVCVTGGVDADNLADWIAGGSDGVGIGSALYKPGKAMSDVAADAQRFAQAARAATR